MLSMTLKQHAADLFGITLSPEQVAQFETYAQELAVWNDRINLTAITEPEAVRVRHFLDSLSVVQAANFRPGMRVIDVGTGAGFPGLPLCIAFPGIHLTLMEATGKKITFLEHIAEQLELDHVRTLHARAEEAGHLPDERGRYDVVLARAVARLPALVEYMLPLARLGGTCIAMKGTTAQAEAEDARRALVLLGGQVKGIERIQLPGVPDERYLVAIEKIAPTPAPYPRKPGIPTRKPLA
jgi:16S rRNA (guanine527-N7)-methyltransferase